MCLLLGVCAVCCSGCLLKGRKPHVVKVDTIPVPWSDFAVLRDVSNQGVLLMTGSVEGSGKPWTYRVKLALWDTEKRSNAGEIFWTGKNGNRG